MWPVTRLDPLLFLTSALSCRLNKWVINNNKGYSVVNPLVTSLSRAIKIFPGGRGLSLPIGKTWQLSSVLKLTWYKTLPAAWYYTPLPETRRGKCSRNGCKQELRHVGEWQKLCDPWGWEVSLTRFVRHRYRNFVSLFCYCLCCSTTNQSQAPTEDHYRVL